MCIEIDSIGKKMQREQSHLGSKGNITLGVRWSDVQNLLDEYELHRDLQYE